MVYFEVDFMPQEKVYEDAEVHDMNDMGHASSREGSSAKEVQNGAPVVWKALSVIIAMMALAYDISPLDLSPDRIPVLGWLDDAGIILVAALNAYHQFAKDQSALSVRLAKYVKWMMVAVLVIAAAVIIGLYVTIPRLD
jgi:uncharacterized membrane protein YkvA (DUF1232 family)